MPDRKAKRFKAAHRIRVSFVGAAARLSGELVDLSNSGLLVRCSETPELETLGRLGIEMGRESIRIVAVVRRHVSGVGVAFKFNHMNPRDRELLHRLVLRLGTDSLR